MTVQLEQHCETAQRIIAKNGTLCVVGGEPTDLYWHLHYCGECRELRDQKAEGGE